MDNNRRRRDPVGRSEHISLNFNRWWYLPLGILNVSALIAVSIMIFGPSFIGRSPNAVRAQGAASEPGVDCSGALSTDYSCYQKRYQDLVYNSGVKAAFSDLKDKFTKDQFVNRNCHQLTHVIGRAAANLYGGDVASTYSRGDDFCASGYYHGAMETVVANIGADKILDEVDNICADLRERQNQSLNHRNCAHGMGHGFMGLYQNELFEALEACDAVSEEWEREHCSGGVFMENVMDEDNPSNPSKYLKADQPFYPCTEVKTEYKHECYWRNTVYALKTQGNDFAKVFDLCGKVEDDFRRSCYIGLGTQAASQSTFNHTTDESQTEFIGEVCMQGQDIEAQSTCLGAAVRQLIFFYNSDVQAKALCESLMSADWRAACLQLSDEYMAERRR